jgi:hypothetical protein
VVVDGGPEQKKWTDLIGKRYNIWKITVTLYNATASGVILRGYRLIGDALSKLTAYSDKLKNIRIGHPLAVLSADRITSRCTTEYSLFRRTVVHDAALLIELVNITSTTENCIQGIDDTASLIAPRARQLE